MPDSETTHSEILRDKIFEHLPPQARKSLMGVKVTFWPNDAGEMVLILEYSAPDATLTIESREGIYGPDEKISGHYVRSCDLDSNTAEVQLYTETMECDEGTTLKIDETIAETERAATLFDNSRQQFFLNLFESL